MTLLLLKDNCAKLFWNPCINVEVMSRTSSVYDHFIIWPTSVTLTFNLPEQIFQMALLLLKDKNCAKLFWYPCINVQVMAWTSSVYDHLLIWPSSVTLTFNWPKKCFKWYFHSFWTTNVPYYFEIHAQMYKLWLGQIWTDTCMHIHRKEILTTMSRSLQASLTKMSHNFEGAVSVTYTIHISNQPLSFYHFLSMLLAILQFSLQPKTGEYVGKDTTKRFSIISTMYPGGTYEYGSRRHIWIRILPPPPPPPPHFRNQQKFTLGGDVNFNILNQSDNSHGRRVLISAWLLFLQSFTLEMKLLTKKWIFQDVTFLKFWRNGEFCELKKWGYMCSWAHSRHNIKNFVKPFDD